MTPAFLILAAFSASAPGPATAPSPLAACVAEDAAVPAAPVETKWSGSISAGAIYQDGNTDARSVNANFNAERRAEQDRWTAKGFWDYGQQKDPASGEFVLSSRKAGASLKYDYFLSKALYVNAVAGADTDTLADLRLRSYVGAGAGYQWREDDTLKWGSEAGVTWMNEDRWAGANEQFPTARVANIVEWKLDEKTSFGNTLEVFPSLERGEDVFGRSDTRLKTSLTKAMFAQLQWIFDYDNTPAAGKGRQDNKVVLGLGWSF